MENQLIQNSPLKLVLNEGQGRAFVIVYDDANYEKFARSISEILHQRSKVLLFKCEQVDASNWRELSLELTKQLEHLAVRQASLVGLGAAGSLVQYLSLTEVKLTRSLVLVDGTCRPHPNWRDRLIDKIERSLPLGLPFRSSTEGFDSKSYLQRVRCPVLLVNTTLASSFVREQTAEMADSFPTAWMVDLSAQGAEAELAKLVEEFQDVPVKCPQKRLA